MSQGLQEGERDFGVKVRSILCCMRHQPSECDPGPSRPSDATTVTWPGTGAYLVASVSPHPHPVVSLEPISWTVAGLPSGQAQNFLQQTWLPREAEPESHVTCRRLKTKGACAIERRLSQVPISAQSLLETVGCTPSCRSCGTWDQGLSSGA